jgi:hypothetical protein
MRTLGLEYAPKRKFYANVPTFAFAWCAILDKDNLLTILFAHKPAQSESGQQEGVYYLFDKLKRSQANAGWTMLDGASSLDNSQGDITSYSKYVYKVFPDHVEAITVGNAVDALRAPFNQEVIRGALAAADEVAKILRSKRT